jgi:uncharacterized tellurite resistance protein B-like protein
MSFFIFLVFIAFIVYHFYLKGKNAKASRSVRMATISGTTTYTTPSQTAPTTPLLKGIWVPQGESFMCRGYEIPGGMLYFGEQLPSAIGYGTEPSLINPRLGIDTQSLDEDGHLMRYWPAYGDMNPACRATYLKWLSTGKNDPGINIGYVFVYFYGLERRLLYDSRSSAVAEAEVASILEEIRRLLSIYGNNNSFRTYANNLISITQMVSPDKKLYNEPVPFFSKNHEYPLTLKLALGQLAADGIPLPAEWALAWVKFDPTYFPRTPAQRCQAEFSKLFQHKYHERYGDGYVLKVNKTKIHVGYTPASRSFGGQVEVRRYDLPDVTALKMPGTQLIGIAEECINELDPYSRYIGRKPNDTLSPAALALLPRVCLTDSADEKVSGLSEWLQGVLSTKFAHIDLSALLKFFPSVKGECIDKRDSLAISQFLAKFGVGIEPDVRFGGNNYRTGPVILFKLPSNSPNAPTPEYNTAVTILHLAAMLASADGSISHDEEHMLRGQLGTWFNLEEYEKARLHAHLQWLLASRPTLTGIKKKFEQMSIGNRSAIAKFLVSLVQSHGFINPDEMKTLAKIYGLLGLDVQNLYSDAHNAAVEPVTVKSEAPSVAFSIPAPPKVKRPDKIGLDAAKIKAKMAETAEVSAILRDIFSDAEPVVCVPVVETKTGTGFIPGLDPEYEAFAIQLSQKTIWTRAELEHLASEAGILLDGTLEAINDASFEAFGEAFSEGEDPIELNTNVLEEIKK